MTRFNIKSIATFSACLAMACAPGLAGASASSSGLVWFGAVTFVDLDTSDGIAPGLSWQGGLSFADGVVDADADGLSHPQNDHKLVSAFGSASASMDAGVASSSSSLTAGSFFYDQVASQGSTGPGGSYQSIAEVHGIALLSRKTKVTFSGLVAASATAGPAVPDYAKGNAFVRITNLNAPGADAVRCDVSDTDWCVKPFSFTIQNDTLGNANVGFELLTSVEGFAAPVPEPSGAVLVLSSLLSLGVLHLVRAARQ